MATPSVQSCTITGRFLLAYMDGPDQDREPDVDPIEGLQITLRPHIAPALVRDTEMPAIIQVATFQASTDEQGYVVDRFGERDIKVVATNDPALSPTAWKYLVTIEGDDFPKNQFYIVAPAGGVVDLATAVRVPADPGRELIEWQDAVGKTTAARDQAVAAKTAAEEARAHTVTAALDPGTDDVLILSFPTYMLSPDSDRILILPIGVAA